MVIRTPQDIIWDTLSSSRTFDPTKPYVETADNRVHPYLNGIRYANGAPLTVEEMVHHSQKTGWHFLTDPKTRFSIALLRPEGLEALSHNAVKSNGPRLSALGMEKFDLNMVLHQYLHAINEPVSDTHEGRLPPLMGTYPYALLDSSQVYGILAIGPLSAKRISQRTVITMLDGYKNTAGLDNPYFTWQSDPLEAELLKSAARKFREVEGVSGLDKLEITYDVVTSPRVVARVDGGFPILSQIEGQSINELLGGMRPVGNRRLGLVLDNVVLRNARDRKSLPSEERGDSLVGKLTYEALPGERSSAAYSGNRWTGLLEVAIIQCISYDNPRVRGIIDEMLPEDTYTPPALDDGHGFLTMRGAGLKSSGFLPSLSSPKVGRTRATDIKSINVQVSGVIGGETLSAFRLLLTHP